MEIKREQFLCCGVVRGWQGGLKELPIVTLSPLSGGSVKVQKPATWRGKMINPILHNIIAFSLFVKVINNTCSLWKIGKDKKI